MGEKKCTQQKLKAFLLSIDGVADAAVVGAENLILGQVVEAHIYPDENQDKAALTKRIKAVCKEKLEKYKRPMKIVYSETSFRSERFKKKRS